ncbi:hypothetical protein AB0T83_00500 [Fluviibacterium sp. DFM31]|uniref:Uncharacterized protein n=1 Tax=Meridianimarinicoccus marinus TaxID=3231483 RepID=A0ABV3L142_9RHOB
MKVAVTIILLSFALVKISPPAQAQVNCPGTHKPCGNVCCPR